MLPAIDNFVKLFIIVPAFNESAVINKVIRSLPKKIKGISQVNKLVIDDGSFDETAQKAKNAGVQVIRHSINRGVGAATKTGFEVAKMENADIIVTLDADGQHDTKDIQKIIDPIIKKKSDVVIGSRFKKLQKVPKDRLVLNWLANFATFAIFGVFSTDSQSGFRAFSKKALELIDIKSDRMEFSSELLHEANKNKLKVKEVSIKAIYTSYSRQKGQKNTNALPIFSRFLMKFLR